jgi:16S rRNA (cytidine1402-2'-O)-methyltransferase
MENDMETGTLYIIATPIGNMEDITMRAVRILKEEIETVYCEDTRQSRKLLEAYGVSVSARSLHAHSSDARIAEACDELLNGRTIGYLTDSGTPSLSDPGSRLVQEARRRGIPVIPLPGPSALAALVSVAGFPEKNIIFGGFLSKKPGKRIHELERLREFSGIIIVYESPYRIRKLIEAIKEVFPDRPVIIGREMTKRFEEYITGTATEIFERRESITEKGEFSIAIHNDL